MFLIRAVENAECGGTFDSSGAFHGYSNDDSNLPKHQEAAYCKCNFCDAYVTMNVQKRVTWCAKIDVQNKIINVPLYQIVVIINLLQL